jgi:hypothetical protein
MKNVSLFVFATKINGDEDPLHSVSASLMNQWNRVWRISCILEYAKWNLIPKIVGGV